MQRDLCTNRRSRKHFEHVYALLKLFERDHLFGRSKWFSFGKAEQTAVYDALPLAFAKRNIFLTGFARLRLVLVTRPSSLDPVE
jgi:hypothetical protein